MLANTWEWIRIFGFLAYFYFTIAVLFGLLRKSAYVKKHKNFIYHLHTLASWLGFFSLLGHMLLLILDKYEPYTIGELLIPFYSDYESIYSALGIVAFYIFLVVIFTSDLLIVKMKKNIWKGIHMLVFPAWLLSLLHGLFIGTDSENPVVLTLYVGSAGLVLIVTLARMLVRKKTTAKHAKATVKTS